MTDSERINELLKFTGLNFSKLAKEIGLNTVQTLYDIKNGKHGISKEVAEKIQAKYFNLSMAWLLTGEGEMLNTETIHLLKKQTRPRIPYDAAAGTLTDTINGVSKYECEQVQVIGIFPTYDFTIRITGRSMEPEFFSGDEVACKRINEERFIQWGRVHVLDTTQGVVIKRIYDDGEKIRCNSYNKEFPDFSIPKEDIRSYNLVVGSIRL